MTTSETQRKIIVKCKQLVEDEDLCDPDGEVEVRELYQAYCTWCSDNDQSHKQDITAFGKSLHAVLSTVERIRSTKGSRPYVYRGISLKSAAATGF